MIFLLIAYALADSDTVLLVCDNAQSADCKVDTPETGTPHGPVTEFKNTELALTKLVIIASKEQTFKLTGELTSLDTIIITGVKDTLVTLSLEAQTGLNPTLTVNGCNLNFTSKMTVSTINLDGHNSIVAGGKLKTKQTLTLKMSEVKKYNVGLDAGGTIHIKDELNSESGNTILISDDGIAFNEDSIKIGTSGYSSSAVTFSFDIKKIATLKIDVKPTATAPVNFDATFTRSGSLTGNLPIEFTSNWDSLKLSSAHTVTFNFPDTLFDVKNPPLTTLFEIKKDSDIKYQFPFELAQIEICLLSECNPKTGIDLYIDAITLEQFNRLLEGVKSQNVKKIYITIKDNTVTSIDLSNLKFINRDLEITLEGPSVKYPLTISESPKGAYKWTLKNVELTLNKNFIYSVLTPTVDNGIISTGSANKAYIDLVKCSTDLLTACYKQHAAEAEITISSLDISTTVVDYKVSKTKLTILSTEIKLGTTEGADIIFADKIKLLINEVKTGTSLLKVTGEGTENTIPITLYFKALEGSGLISVDFDKTSFDKIPSSQFTLSGEDDTIVEKIVVKRPISSKLSMKVECGSKIYDLYPIIATNFVVCVNSAEDPTSLCETLTDQFKSIEDTFYTVTKTSTDLNSLFSDEKFSVQNVIIGITSNLTESIILPLIDLNIFELISQKANSVFSASVTPSKDNIVKELILDHCEMNIAGNNFMNIDVLNYYEDKSSKLIGNAKIKVANILDKLVSSTLQKGISINRLVVNVNIEKDYSLTFDEASFILPSSDEKATNIIKPINEESFNANVTFFSLIPTKSVKLTLSLKEKKVTSILPVTFLINLKYEESQSTEANLLEDHFVISPEFDDSWKDANVSATVFRFYSAENSFDDAKLNETVPNFIKLIVSTNGEIPKDDDNLDPDADNEATSDFDNSGDEVLDPKKKGLDGGAIAGIVIACVVVVAGIVVGVVFFIRKKKARVSGGVKP